jgi:pilus assembly protein CpaE
MSNAIKVLVVNAAPDAHQAAVRRALEREPGFEVADVVVSAPGGTEVLDTVPLLRPDIVVIDLDAEGVDGLGLTEALAARHPWVSVVAASAATEPDFLRRVGLAGARHLLGKPYSEAELVRSVRQVYHLDAARRASHAVAVPQPGGARRGTLFAFYGAKGGLGCTTLACNVAVALKQLTDKAVALLDCGLLFGDVALMLNLDPPQPSILDLLPHMGSLDAEVLGKAMAPHSSGVQVLLAPPVPEKSELVAPKHVRAVLAALRDQFDYVVIDTWPTFEERMLHVLDAADKLVVPTTLELPAIKNTKLLLEVLSALGHHADKIAIVLNRVGSRVAVRVSDAEETLQQPFAAKIASDWRLASSSAEKGVPFVVSDPNAPISADVVALARALIGQTATEPEARRPRRWPW